MGLEYTLVKSLYSMGSAKGATHAGHENDTITVGALGVRFLVEAGDSNGTASVFECLVPANSRMPAPHSHDGFEETIYGIEGTTAWTIDGARRGRARRGGGGATGRPPLTTTATSMRRSWRSRPRHVFGPAYFREIGEVLAASAGGPPDLAALGEIMRRHGLTPAPPSAA